MFVCLYPLKLSYVFRCIVRWQIEWENLYLFKVSNLKQFEGSRKGIKRLELIDMIMKIGVNMYTINSRFELKIRTIKET